MKVYSDQIRQANQEQQKVKPRQDGGISFDEVLQSESGKQAAQAAPVAPPPPLLGVSPLLNVQAPTQVAPTKQAEQTVMQNVDKLLTNWENYAQALDGSQGGVNLKEAYSALERISDDVKQIKEDNPDLGDSSPELDSMVNELEIMTVTETFKFNRGDYS